MFPTPCSQLVRIHNPNDRLCLARAVLLGMHDRETRMAGGGGKAAFNLFASRQDQHGPAAAQMLDSCRPLLANRDMYTLDDVQTSPAVAQQSACVATSTTLAEFEQLFDVPNYCIDCERRADARYHAFGCKVVCRLCLRYGPGYPCQTEQLPNGGSSARKVR
ncbi:hypothetical protein niasHT_028744 [Heterodera trifolii]|uniref:Uncharacterized protein n=1 Tax=Heterodera trifolii TaxID=157864 RepID=A0ABD2KLL5_9BILA